MSESVKVSFCGWFPKCRSWYEFTEVEYGDYLYPSKADNQISEEKVRLNKGYIPKTKEAV